MGYRLYNEAYVSSIASMIRTKNGASSTYRLSEMVKAIADIPTRSEQDMEDMLLMGVLPRNFFFGEYSDSEVTVIGNRVFEYCPSLTSVNFPVCTLISDYAFSGCSSLRFISFPKCTAIGT